MNNLINENDLKNINKIGPIFEALMYDSIKQFNTQEYYLKLAYIIVENHFKDNLKDYNFKTLYKAILHDAILNDTTISDIIISILYDYYKVNGKISG